MNSLKKKQVTIMRELFPMRVIGNSNFLHLDCPYCGKKMGRAGIYSPAYSNYKCWQGSCEAHEGIWVMKLIQDQLGLSTIGEAFDKVNLAAESSEIFIARRRKYADRKKVVLPKPAKLISEGNSFFANKARAYLQGRGYDIEYLAEKFLIHYVDTIDQNDNLFGYLVIPFFDVEGTLIYYQLRAYLPGKMRWKNPKDSLFNIGKEKIMYNESALLRKSKDLWLHEGATDAWIADNPGQLGLYITDTYVSKIRKYAISKTIYNVLDGGEWATILANCHDLFKTGLDVFATNLPGLTDPGDLGCDKLYEAVNTKSILINPDNYIEELDRIEFKWVMNKGKKSLKSFRGKHKRKLWAIF